MNGSYIQTGMCQGDCVHMYMSNHTTDKFLPSLPSLEVKNQQIYMVDNITTAWAVPTRTCIHLLDVISKFQPYN